MYDAIISMSIGIGDVRSDWMDPLPDVTSKLRDSRVAVSVSAGNVAATDKSTHLLDTETQPSEIRGAIAADSVTIPSGIYSQ